MIRIQVSGSKEVKPKGWFRAAEHDPFSEVIDLKTEYEAKGMACIHWRLPTLDRCKLGIKLFIVTKRGMPAIEQKILTDLKIIEVCEMHIQVIDDE